MGGEMHKNTLSFKVKKKGLDRHPTGVENFGKFISFFLRDAAIHNSESLLV
jgi:hypothetical protein